MDTDIIIAMIAAFLIGAVLAGLAVTVSTEDCETCPTCEVCEVCEDCIEVKEVDCEVCEDTEVEIEVEIEVPYFDGMLWVDEAWDYVIENWNSEDFDDELKYCGEDKYSLDEISWKVYDKWFDYHIEDLPDNEKEVCFKVRGRYDDDDQNCDAKYWICLTYDGERDPEVNIEPYGR